MFLYLCEDLEPGPTGHQLDERLETVTLPWDEAVAMARDGRINDAKTLLSLFICEELRRSSVESLISVSEVMKFHVKTRVFQLPPERQRDETNFRM